MIVMAQFHLCMFSNMNIRNRLFRIIYPKYRKANSVSKPEIYEYKSKYWLPC